MTVEVFRSLDDPEGIARTRLAVSLGEEAFTPIELNDYHGGRVGLYARDGGGEFQDFTLKQPAVFETP